MTLKQLWPLLALVAAPALAAPPPVKPKLYVVIAMDQFSAGLFDQYRDRFTGGLKRMAREGVVFPNAYQSHAATETCPGHSTLLTGRHPAATGIVGNSWFDAASQTTVYCVADPAGPVPGRDDSPRGAGTMKVSTFGEWLHAANPASRSYAVSAKDRAAITMAGHNATGVFWWDDELGFTTSVPAGTTAAARLAPVKAFNAATFASWSGGLPGWAATDSRCPTTVPATTFGSLTVDHRLPPEGWSPVPTVAELATDPVVKRRLRASPAMDRLTLALAERLIADQKLGQGSAPDVLAVSLSATDYVGHTFGNGGPEMCQHLMEVDAALGSFFATLHALHVPLVVALTADHGSVDAAERSSERGFPALRFSPDQVAKDIGAAIATDMKLPDQPLAGDGTQISVTGAAAANPAQRSAVITAAVAAFRLRPEVAAVFTKPEVLAAMPPRGKPADEMSVIERFALSTDAARSGDVIVAYKPYVTGGNPKKPGDTVAGHGSPWNYDRRVPLLFWWPGATGFEQSLPVETTDIAPTLAALAGVATPEVDGRCLDLDVGVANSCWR